MKLLLSTTDYQKVNVLCVEIMIIHAKAIPDSKPTDYRDIF
jgi:hypothetical protein